MSKALLEAVAEASRRVFGQLPIVPHRTGNKILRQRPKGPVVAAYYPVINQQVLHKFDPEWQSEEDDRRQEWLYRMKRRGKGAPKKGEGKRKKK